MTEERDPLAHNAAAWDRFVAQEIRWTVPAGPEEIAAAREGRWRIVLTPTIPVPREWLPALPGADVLCLASGGGQQGPVLAAAGARVTVLDNSEAQLAQDRSVAEREGLELRTVRGDMRDLSACDDASFDAIVHPVSNCFVPDVRPVWRECHRVLRPGGVLIAGFSNGVIYLFDWARADRGEFELRHRLPYPGDDARDPDDIRRVEEEGEPLEWGHTLEAQVGGQLEAGFVLTALYEDRDPAEPLGEFSPLYLATRAVKR